MSPLCAGCPRSVRSAIGPEVSFHPQPIVWQLSGTHRLRAASQHAVPFRSFVPDATIGRSPPIPDLPLCKMMSRQITKIIPPNFPHPFPPCDTAKTFRSNGWSGPTESWPAGGGEVWGAVAVSRAKAWPRKHPGQRGRLSGRSGPDKGFSRESRNRVPRSCSRHPAAFEMRSGTRRAGRSRGASPL